MHSSRLALDDEADKAGAAGKVYFGTVDGKKKAIKEIRCMSPSVVTSEAGC